MCVHILYMYVYISMCVHIPYMYVYISIPYSAYRISSLSYGSFAKETYNYIDPTNQRHPAAQIFFTGCSLLDFVTCRISNMYANMYIHIYMYIFGCMHTYMFNTGTYLYVYVYTHLYVYVYT